MFSNLGFGEFLMMGVLGLVIFGPERLPKAASDAVRVIRQLRSMADSAISDIKAELPSELADLDLRSLSPQGMLRKAIFDDTPSTETEAEGDDEMDGETYLLLDPDVTEGQAELLDASLQPVPVPDDGRGLPPSCVRVPVTSRSQPGCSAEAAYHPPISGRTRGRRPGRAAPGPPCPGPRPPGGAGPGRRGARRSSGSR